MSTINYFTDAYNKLNPQQKEAVDTIDGPVMVIAGPGTGKTQILALRIANILKQTDTAPDSILALTFTDAGAHAMRERLRQYLGEESYKVAIHTFHSLASYLIKNYPDAYPNIIGGRPASDIEKTSIIENIINTEGITHLRPTGDPLYYVKKIPGAITELKKENISPDNFSGLINDLETRYLEQPKYHEKGTHKGKVRAEYKKNEKHIERLRELSLIYRLYQAELQNKKLFDFEDMIVESVKAMEQNPDMLLDLQEKYQYILADEHQDVNEAQNKILELLSNFHEHPNIFVVGDEKQAIYRFQGASLYNFLYFESRFKDTKVISLTENYRSSQPILDAAFNLIESQDEDLKKLRVELFAKGKYAKSVTKPELRQFPHEAVEDEWVVSKIKETINNNIPLEEIAIIVRHNDDVIHFTNLLRQFGIDASPSAESDILSHPLTVLIENLLTVIARPDDQECLFNLLISNVFNLEADDIITILSAKNYHWPLGRLIHNQEKLLSLDLVSPEKVAAVSTILKTATDKSLVEPPHQVLQYLLSETKLIDRLMEMDPLENTRILRRLYDDIQALVIENKKATVREVVSLLVYRRTHNLALIAPFIDSDKTAVKVTTAHKAKGLEFETVIIPHVTDSAFGPSKTRDYFKLPIYQEMTVDSSVTEEDERRLLYVAMTRAKANLYISYSDTNVANKLQDISRFLLDIPSDKLESIETTAEQENFDTSKVLKHPLPKLIISKDLIKNLFLQRGLSVTHLNNYLEDPHKYLYDNLLRKPQPQSLSLIKGNSVHETLEKAVTIFKTTGEWPSINDISNYLRNSLEKRPLNTSDITRLHQDSLTALTLYIEHLKNNIGHSANTEYRITTNLPTDLPDIPEIPLNGNIDRIDFDKDGNTIRVVDYKTGNPKSLNVIEGKTKDSNGNYKRQLVFYALLFELSNPEESRPKEYTLSFVQPKPNGNIVEYSFAITDEEIAELKATITKVAEEIVTGKFLETI